MNNNIYQTIGRNIKKYRKLKGVNQEKLANMTNLSYGFIKNLEAKNVHATISIETLDIIARALDIKITNLFED